MEEKIDEKVLEPVADKLKIKKTALPKLLVFWGIFGIVLNVFWLFNAFYPLSRLFHIQPQPSFWWQYALYIFFILISIFELALGIKLERQDTRMLKIQKIHALLLLLVPLFLSILLSPLSLISTLHFFQTDDQKVACTLEAKLCPDGSSVGRSGPDCSFDPCPSVTPTLDPTAGWKTYTNPKFGYLIKYPTTLAVSDQSPAKSNNILMYPYKPNDESKPGAYGGPIRISVLSNQSNLSLSDFITGNITHESFQSEKISVSDSTALKIHDNSGLIPAIEVFFEKDNYVYEVALISGNNVSEATFNQILSTFKFINTQTTNTSPTPSCIPRPACLDATPRCMIAEPANGWCPN